MSIYFVITAPNASTRLTREAQFRETYAARDIQEGETVGIMPVEEGGLRSFCGSFRVDSSTAATIQEAHSSWLTVHDSSDFLGAWDYP
jgi:hypothetical protein